MTELFDDDSIECLLKSIPVSEIIQSLPQCAGYKKVQASAEVCDSYGISDLPALLVFSEQQLLGSVSGYVESEQSYVLIEKLGDIIGNSRV